MATIDIDDFVTTADAAKSLGVSVDAVKHYCQNGTLEAVKAGHVWLIPKKEIARYKKERKAPGRPKSNGS